VYLGEANEKNLTLKVMADVAAFDDIGTGPFEIGDIAAFAGVAEDDYPRVKSK
jgi:hypothetical protein